jgi:Na+-transporting methylmalonyl-CoA/oxaloacetate decarboxylase beta subunit
LTATAPPDTLPRGLSGIFNAVFGFEVMGLEWGLKWIGILFWGDDTGTVALIGGKNGPSTIFITSKISNAGMIPEVSALNFDLRQLEAVKI